MLGQGTAGRKELVSSCALPRVLCRSEGGKFLHNLERADGHRRFHALM